MGVVEPILHALFGAHEFFLGVLELSRDRSDLTGQGLNFVEGPFHPVHDPVDRRRQDVGPHIVESAADPFPPCLRDAIGGAILGRDTLQARLAKRVRIKPAGGRSERRIAQLAAASAGPLLSFPRVLAFLEELDVEKRRVVVGVATSLWLEKKF